MLRQLGADPSFAQRLLVRRIARTALQLEIFDEKLATGAWSEHDSRVYGGLQNALRLALKEVGLKPVVDKTPSLEAILAEHASPKAAAE